MPSTLSTTPVRDEDVVFAQWQSLPEGPEKELQEEILIRLLRKHAHAVVWLMLGEHREDIVQEAIGKAVTKIEGFKGDSKFSTWFQAIVSNECKMHMRDNKVVEVGLEDMDVATESNPEHKILLKQIEGQLNEQQKELLRMKYDGLTESEIAERLGINLVTVRQRWMRLREQVNKDGKQ